ncbi:hypothetical protein [Paenibacillus sp. MZ04-78.2]|nr:hypothetical protein [Paenibacillus sp. MZ04-78.2]
MKRIFQDPTFSFELLLANAVIYKGCKLIPVRFNKLYAAEGGRAE